MKPISKALRMARVKEITQFSIWFRHILSYSVLSYYVIRKFGYLQPETQLSQRDRATRHVSTFVPRFTRYGS